jgi:hypothetical protein
MAMDKIVELMIAERDKLDAAIKLLRGGDGSGSIPSPKKSVQAVKPGKRVMSPEAKAKIAEAQRARWAKTKKAAKKATTVKRAE